MSKRVITKVTIERNDGTAISVEGDDARKWQEHTEGIEGLARVHGSGDLDVKWAETRVEPIDWKARAIAAEKRVEELRGAALCPVCTGNPISDRPCICGGTGKVQDAYHHLNRQHHDTEADVEGLTASRDHYRVGLSRAVAELAEAEARVSEIREAMRTQVPEAPANYDDFSWEAGYMAARRVVVRMCEAMDSTRPMRAVRVVVGGPDISISSRVIAAVGGVREGDVLWLVKEVNDE